MRRRPDWVPAPAWERLEVVLRAQPRYADDALADLRAATAAWDAAARERLLDHVLIHAESGILLPAAFIRGLSDLLDRDG